MNDKQKVLIIADVIGKLGGNTLEMLHLSGKAVAVIATICRKPEKSKKEVAKAVALSIHDEVLLALTINEMAEAGKSQEEIDAAVEALCNEIEKNEIPNWLQ